MTKVHKKPCVYFFQLKIDQTNLEKDEDDSDIPSIYVEFLENTMRRLSAALAEKMKAFEELQEQHSGISEGSINLSDVLQLDEEIEVSWSPVGYF